MIKTAKSLRFKASIREVSATMRTEDTKKARHTMSITEEHKILSENFDRKRRILKFNA
jgi:hypothetical protein